MRAPRPAYQPALQSVGFKGNPLGEEALTVQIPALEARGVEVSYESD